VSDSLLLFILCMQEPECLQCFIHGYASPIIPWSCAGFYEWLVVILMMFLVELDQLLLMLALLLPVACPAPPCAWFPSWPALHLLGSWPAPCYFWSSLSNHIAWLWLWFWFGEVNSPLMLNSWVGRTWFCAGAVVLWLLVLWCWCCGCWCCGAGAVVAVVLVG
jgi:hypothetical protein